MAKTHSLFNLKPTEKPNTNTKQEKSLAENNTKQEKLSDKNNTKQDLSTTWHKTTNELPDENRPIIINSEGKKLIHGYRLNNHNYIVNDAYYLDRFKKKHNYVEWQYVKGCINLENCDRQFPNCDYCNFAKTLNKKG